MACRVDVARDEEIRLWAPAAPGSPEERSPQKGLVSVFSSKAADRPDWRTHSVVDLLVHGVHRGAPDLLNEGPGVR